MIAKQILFDLARLGVEVVVDGDRLRGGADPGRDGMALAV